jgi:hypothetical protein
MTTKNYLGVIIISVVATLMIVAGFNSIPRAQAQGLTTDAAKQVPGRWVMYYSPLNRADTFLVDSSTGKAYQIVKDTDGSSVLQYTPMIGG